QISNLKSQMPELPDAKLKRFIEDYALSEYDAEILTREKPLADYFEEAVKVGEKEKLTPKHIANWIINKKINIEEILPATLIKQILAAIQTIQIDKNELEKIISQVIEENTQAVNDYKKGKETVIMFLVGQVMKKAGKKIDAQIVKEKLKEKLVQ
ncbi:MAG TPA: hypothetical protein VF810_04380, partial [Patescibacteria group bacterium]